MTKYNYNIKLDIPQDADSARYFIPEGYTARIEDGVLIIEPEESEDERILNELLATFEAMRDGDDYWHGIYCGDIIAYLKSLKNRGNFLKSNTNSPWKPSEEQIRCLDMVLTDEAMDDNVHTELTALKKQLQKLM